jgi:hypothetical protein
MFQCGGVERKLTEAADMDVIGAAQRLHVQLRCRQLSLHQVDAMRQSVWLVCNAALNAVVFDTDNIEQD